MTTVRGRCRCGTIEVELVTAREPGTLPVRRCSCSFCRQKDARTVTDRGGRMTVRVVDPTRVQRLRFALHTCEFLVCTGCGDYVVAVLRLGDRAWATLNVNAGTLRGQFPGAGTAVDYTGETAEQRIARRKASWTPARIIGLP